MLIFMKLIVGLGNPGKVYAVTRHNVGFQVVQALARDCKALLKKDKAALSLSARSKIEGEGVILAQPLTFMNLSGLAVKALLKEHKIKPENLLVVCDDLDLGFGRIKIRAGGSSAGHRGLKNIIDALATQDFCRLRIGIGRPPKGIDAAEYVLLPFSHKEKEEFKGTIEKAVSCSKLWVASGITASMNRFNKRSENA